MAKVGFVGLGVMGAPMAGHLVDAGHDVTVWNRTPSKSEPFRAKGATVAPSLAKVGSGAEIVFLCVGTSEDVAGCVADMSSGFAPGATIVDHSTISPQVAARLNGELAIQGVGFLDAPVTGGSMGAQKGQLTIFCGGSSSDYEKVKPVIAAYAKRSELVGGAGAGQTMKVANQIAVGGALLALCEALSFAKKAGLDLAQTRELLASGAAGSWAFENYGPKILAQDWSPGFSIKNQRKDFRYAAETAQNIDAAIPGTRLVDRLLAVLEEQGHRDWTTAALYCTLLESGFETWM